MANGVGFAGAAGGAAGAAIANAIKACGAIVQVSEQDFLDILARSHDPIVVHSPAGLLTKQKYMTSYKGLIFYTKTKQELVIPASVEIVNAKKIWIPEM